MGTTRLYCIVPSGQGKRALLRFVEPHSSSTLEFGSGRFLALAVTQLEPLDLGAGNEDITAVPVLYGPDVLTQDHRPPVVHPGNTERAVEKCRMWGIRISDLRFPRSGRIMTLRRGVRRQQNR